jgi:hypothetical protein
MQVWAAVPVGHTRSCAGWATGSLGPVAVSGFSFSDYIQGYKIIQNLYSFEFMSENLK